VFNGVYTLAFVALWLRLAASDPRSCTYITDGELDELTAAGVLVGGAAATGKPQAPSATMPWRILWLPSVWAVFIGHIAFNYNRYLMYNWILTYYTDALRVPVTEAGLYMFWPNFFDALLSFGVGRAADALAASGRVSTLSTRRVFAALGFLGTGVGAALLPLADSPAAATVLVTFASSMQACHNAGFKSSYGDLSREYSGFLRGIGNTLGTGSSFVVPMLAAWLLELGGGSTEKVAWQAVFRSVLACSIVGTGCYIALVSTENVDAGLSVAATSRKDAKKEK